MGDTMLLGVLRMPVDDHGDISLKQFIDRGRQAADRIERDADRIAELEAERYAIAEERDTFAAQMERLRGPAAELAATVENREELPLQKWALKCARLVSQVQNAEAVTHFASLARHDAELMAKPFSGIQGCGDHGCVIEKPTGAGTNGGCRCHLDRSKASIIVQRLAQLRDAAHRQAE